MFNQLNPNQMSYLKALRKAFPQFQWEHNESVGSYHANIINNGGTKRTSDKAVMQYGNIHMYISGDMYPGTSKNFIYAMCYQLADRREYRHKSFYKVESNKVFVSGKNMDAIVKKLIKEVDMSVYTMGIHE